MKLLVALCLGAVVAAASPPTAYKSDDNVQVLRFDNDNIGRGSYKFAFEQSDGTRQEQQGQLKNEGRDDETISVQGSYSWVGPDGVTYVVNYVADENGYQPEIEQGPGGGVPHDLLHSLLGG